MIAVTTQVTSGVDAELVLDGGQTVIAADSLADAAAKVVAAAG